MGILIVAALFGMVYLLMKRRDYKHLTAETFPEVPPETFEKWRSSEVKSRVLLCWSLGFFALYSLVTLTENSVHITPTGQISIGPSFIVDLIGERGLHILRDDVLFAPFLVLAVLSAFAGSRAKRIKKKNSIEWP